MNANRIAIDVVHAEPEVTTPADPDLTTRPGWPSTPATCPAIMGQLEVAMYLRIDQVHQDPAKAKRALRHMRRRQGLPCLGRVCGRALFNKASIDRWITDREANEAALGTPT